MVNLARKSNINVLSPRQFSVALAAIAQFFSEVGCRSAETGSILGGNFETMKIDHVFFDQPAQTSTVTYSSNTEALNSLLMDEWNHAGIRLLGFIHMHSGQMNRPSYGDARYATGVTECQSGATLPLYSHSNFQHRALL